ncbi:hypothetical protein YH65_06130 [Sulfurovum lithotrophicum]|uniref:AB hydrolase-1 domain-containing protein n=1 Tax=Sulfurovum lithotrophicum TaxID=206403 RepID=A0A7U4RQR3_9BACT|nr:alpha/beta hydrolase [Sulfurovum lithotrophicum]AKF25016.1 hypothetical protein YH65_06130 [Sulfurovum lithotrophicum]
MHHPLKVKLIRAYFAIVSYLFPALAVLSAYRLFHHPVNTKRKNAKEKKVPAPQRFIIKVDEKIQLQAYRWGEADHPPVLLVHGWSTTSRSMSNFLDLLLRNDFQVISYDAVQHGESEGKASDLAGWADSVRAVMRETGPVKCIIAHSFGAAAVTVASKLGLDTRKLVLVAPIHDIIEVADRFAERLGIPKKIVEEMRDYTWAQNKTNFHKYGKDWKDILHSNFHVPTLIFHDVGDREIGIEHSRQLCQLWPWAVLRKTKGLGHRKILDDGDVAKEIVAFIKNGSE